MLKVETDMGLIILDEAVIYSIVAGAATKCFGVAGMTAKNSSEEFWNLFKKNFDKGIHVSCTDNEIEIEVHIMVIYGINIPAITESIIHKIVYSVEDTTGFKVRNVKLFVDSVCANN